MTSNVEMVAGPVVFITTYAVKDGEQETFQAFLGEVLHALEAEDPLALAV
jgi:hypothetical protein